MKKQKIITICIILFVLVASVVLYFYGQRAKNDVTLVPVIDTKLPLYPDKDKLLGNRDDLVSFTIAPDTEVHGILSYRGTIKEGYFFEGNIIVNILDENKKVLLKSNGISKGDWMTSGPVNFEGNIDFTNLPKGKAYFEIKNDNASGLPANDKSVLIPIIIK